MKMAMREEFFSWANSLFLEDWPSQWEDHFCLMAERIKVVMSVFGKRAGGRTRGLRVAALAATSTRSLPGMPS